MPSASAKLEKQTSLDSNDPVKQVITVVEKKVRNLEKRKAKLDSYKNDSQNGKELNEDQKKAVEKYDQVVELLDFAKDLQKQFQTVIQDFTKAQKKAAKLELLERQQLERQRIKEFLMYQDLLSSMGGDVRQDFLEGNKGAVKLSEEELNSIDELYKIICPERDPEAENADFDNLLSTSAEHIQSLLDAKNKEAFGSTYKSLRETLQKVHTCNYFNKSKTEPAADDVADNSQQSEEREEDNNEAEEFVHQAETFPSSQVEEFHMPEKSEVVSTPVEASVPYYQIENPALYSEQSHPIQEVLSVQGNLNFLQESQIEIESARIKTQVPSSLSGGASYPNAEFVSTQPLPANLVQQHRTHRTSEEATPMPNHPVAANIALANPTSVQPAQPSIPPAAGTTQPIDFDPARPIPTQTYTNQSFTSAIHPMMAVPPNYVPVTIPHTISPAHVLPANMVVPQRSSATNPNSLPISSAHTSVSGLTPASAHSQQANIYSLCLKMNQLGAENPQSAHPPTSQFDCNEIPESNMSKQSPPYGNGGEAHNLGENRARAGSNPYARGSTQMDYRNDNRVYQSTNNSQAYMNRESFADNSSYSSNLKRGLNSQRGSRSTGNAPRQAANNPRGGRVGYRN